MIVPTNYWKENILKMKEEYHNFLVLKVDHLPYSDDQRPLEMGVHVLNLCNSLKMVNDFFKKTGMKKSFDFNILYDVQKAIMNDEALPMGKLKEFYGLMKEVEKFASASANLFPGSEHWYIGTDIQMTLIGFPLRSQIEAEQLNGKNFGFLSDKIFELSMEVLEGKNSVENFSRTAKILCEKFLVKERENRNKRAA